MPDSPSKALAIDAASVLTALAVASLLGAYGWVWSINSVVADIGLRVERMESDLQDLESAELDKNLAVLRTDMEHVKAKVGEIREMLKERP